MKAIFLLAAAATAAHADPNDELTLGTQTRALRSSSADALTDQGYVGGQLSFARRLESPQPLLQLWATAGFDWGGASGEMFQTLTTNIGSVGFTVGGRARYVVRPHLAVSARLDLGEQHVSLELADQNGRTASDAGWGLLAKTAAAVDLFAVDNQGFALGLRAEIGYVAARGVVLAPKSPHDDTQLSIMTGGASIGHLDLGGPYFSISAVSQF